MRTRILPFLLSLVFGLGAGAAWLGFASQRVQASPQGELRVCPGGCVYQTIQDAVDAANPGDVVKVAQGRYQGVSARSGITQVVYVDKSLSILGGFTTTNWNQADPLAYPVTVDAQRLGRGMVISGAISVTVRGINITGGDATDLGGIPQFSSIDLGGGIYVYTATVTIEDCGLFTNTGSTSKVGRGGGIGLAFARATLFHNEIRNNLGSSATQGDGGGVAVWYGRETRLISNTIQFNIGSDLGTGTPTGGAGHGGGVYAYRGDNLLVEGNRIFSNTASIGYFGNGGGVHWDTTSAVFHGNTLQGNVASLEYSGYGGGLSVRNLSGVTVSTTLTGNTFLNNIASKNSIASRSGNGGGASLTHIDGGTVSGNLFRGNIASTGGRGYGGGLSISGSSDAVVQVDANRIISNTATLNPASSGMGGGFYTQGAYLWFSNNIVAENHATTSGSGLYLAGAESPTRYLNNTVAGNLVASAVYISEPPVLAGHLNPLVVYTPTFTNTLLAENAGFALETAVSTTVSLEATLWFGNGGWITGTGETITGSINIYADPAFAAPQDYHLAPGSPAQDTGAPVPLTTDVDGESRPFGWGYDIGADEFLGFVLYLPVLIR